MNEWEFRTRSYKRYSDPSPFGLTEIWDKPAGRCACNRNLVDGKCVRCQAAPPLCFCVSLE